MPIIPDPTPDWLKRENDSVFDTPMISGLKGVARFFGADDPAAAAMSLGAPMMAADPKWHPDPAINAKLASLAKTAHPDLMKEIQEVGINYEAAKKAGDAEAQKVFGKRLAELDRIGRTGVPFTPSGDTVSTPSPFPVEPSPTITSARIKAALDALKTPKK